MKGRLQGWLGATALVALVASVWAAPRACLAGTFIYAGEVQGEDIITHPSGYTSSFSGTLQVSVCVHPSSANASDMLVSLENAAATYTNLEVTTGNLASGSSNNVPPSHVDFESVLLHEVGHCLGLAHPNLASESGLIGADRNYTRTTQGLNGSFDLDRGADNIRGSRDDLRGDDGNLHWFRIADNDPFAIEATVDVSTYSRDLADLPVGDTHAANGDRAVANTLGYSSTEAVMQQGTFNDEAQRRLTADDVATLRLAMAGIDETVGGGDDYTLEVVSQGIGGSCDIIVDFDDGETDFAQCNVQGSYVGSNHIAIRSPRIYFNSGYNWFFNQVPSVGCGSGTLDPGETCDDGDLDAGDGCDPSCQLEVGWSCTGEPSVCSPVCGDSTILGGEQCDDGNAIALDGCDAECSEEVGWTCTGEPSVCVTTCGDFFTTGPEECDDANTSNSDGCANDCTIVDGWSCTGQPSNCSEICGDAQIVGDEACDDGNLLDGDCCSSYCEYEGPGSACADDANPCTDDVCDGAGSCGHVANTAPCEDGDACTANDVCAAGACTPGAPLDCDDGLFCNGLESCVGPTGCVAGSLDLDDGVACTLDGCDEGADVITHDPDHASCDDGVFCSGSEYCDLALDCQSAPLDLDDGVACTVDSCDEGGAQIIHSIDDSACDDGDSCTADSCDEITGCASVPIEGCGALVPGLGAWARLLVSMVLLSVGLFGVSISRRQA